jgi:stage V sporulation protein D (sporulation-specific penicillin-binding protein)
MPPEKEKAGRAETGKLMARPERQFASPVQARAVAADPGGVTRPVTLAEERGLRVVTAGLIILGLALGLRLAYLQTVRSGFYARLGDELGRVVQPDAVRPGTIYDANKRVLADAESVADVAVDPRDARLKDSTKLRQALVQVLGLSPQVVDQKLASSRQYELLLPRVPAAKVAQLRALQLPALVFAPGYQRVYPNGALGAHVLGGYHSDQRPAEGLDLRYRFLLSGQPGTPRHNVDAWGRTIVGMEEDAALPSEPGKSLVTTLDLDLQREVEAALQHIWTYNQPENAVAVVMEPATGAVLALACRPNYDPNDLSRSYPAGQRPQIPERNLLDLPACWVYEPGSTFKVLTAAAALQYHAVTMTEIFHCPGSIMVGGRPLHDWGKYALIGHGDQNLAGILAQSANTGMAQVGMRLGARRFTDFLAGCGLGRPTGVGLPGEASGRVFSPRELRIRDLADMSFGQHVLVTPLQLTAAICGIVNDGLYMQPQLVRQVLNADGSVFRQIQPVQKTVVCTPEVSALIRQILVGVVENGTGRLARIPGVVVGGKTGTAQVWDPITHSFPDALKVVSFVLIAPADRRPDFCILIIANNPKIGEHGADVCAPAAKQIATYLLRREGHLPPGKVDGG